MCEDMANGPDEENSNYVLTEDMIDAAMNQHISFQDDLSDGGSSQDGNLDMDQDSQDSLDAIGCSSTANTDKTQEIDTSTESTDKEPVSSNPNAMRILVIETGLGKSKSDSTEKNINLPNENSPNDVLSSNPIDVNNELRRNSYNEKGPEMSPSYKTIAHAEQNVCNEGEPVLPLLKRILSDNHSAVGNNGEPIDLCDSDTDEMSDDEAPGMEGLIDDELKSVMESNLLAEVNGMTINNQVSSSPILPKKSTPKITVKSMAQQSSANVLTNEAKMNVTTSRETNRPEYAFLNAINHKMNESAGNNRRFDISIGAKNQASSIHINKIAVPHKTIVNSQGKRMKYVYVKNSSSLPVVINSHQSAVNKNVRFKLNTSQVQKLPGQLTPIAALANMTSKTPQFQKLVAKPGASIQIAPRLQKPTVLKNVPPLPHTFQRDSDQDEIIQSLLFHSLVTSYAPSDVTPSTKSYDCLECNDKFVLQSSFHQHMARRSSIINYWCRICAKQIQFFNRCTLFKHLRGHNNTIKHIDTSCIQFNPLPKEMIGKGMLSSLFEDSQITIHQPTTTSNNNHTGNITFTTTMVNGHSKSTCTQVRNPHLLQKNFSGISTSNLNAPKHFPFILPKTSNLAVVPTFKNQTKGNSTNTNILNNNMVLASNKTSFFSHGKKLPSTHAIAQGSVSDMSLKNNETEIVIDDDICKKLNTNMEKEEVDVTDLTIDIDINDKKLSKNAQSLRTALLKPKVKNSSQGNTLKTQKRSCSECGVFCFNVGKHLNGFNRPTKPALACKVCQLILPTRCALNIHHRIHVKMPPFKCPDCGKDFDTWNELQPHLKFSCGHFAKCVRYLCSACKEHFNTANALAHHISEKHSRNIFRCLACPVAFYSEQSLTSHFQSKHPNEKMLGGEYKQCTMCPPRKLIAIKEFFRHVEAHAKNANAPIYGYKCPMCDAVFANRLAFIIHQVKERKTYESKPNENINSLKSVSGKNPLPFNAKVEPDYNSDVEEEPTIIQKPTSQFYDSAPSEKDPLSLEDWEYMTEQRVQEKREEPCIVCKTNVVTLLPGIDLNAQSLCCKQCVKPLDSATLAARVEINKKETPAFLSNGRNSSNYSFKHKKVGIRKTKRSTSCDEKGIVLKRRRVSDVSLPNGSSEGSEMYVDLLSPEMKPAKKKNRKKQTRVEPTSQSHIQGKVITSKSPDELVCSKCEFSASTKDTFIDHIKTHRSDPNDFQCQECGLCFVVLPSLERHLQIHHGIRDANSYIENNLSCLPQKLVLSQAEDDYQCRVCHEMFDSNSSLEKHFRTHGMAFMNSLSKSP